jgi:Nucleotide hydrolase
MQCSIMRSRQLQLYCRAGRTVRCVSAARRPPLVIQIPKNQALVAVPLFELHDSAAKFGSVISGVPAMLSRLR